MRVSTSRPLACALLLAGAVGLAVPAVFAHFPAFLADQGVVRP